MRLFTLLPIAVNAASIFAPAVALALLASPISAADNASPDPGMSTAEARLFEHIVVTARPAPTAAGNVASSISSLGGADLARMGHRHIA
ncbi:MAG: hypothetical protein HKO60_00965, partial [Pseudomonadales bacterium]|nr:hypothetical protein [Pseudomonadales bacterium]